MKGNKAVHDIRQRKLHAKLVTFEGFPRKLKRTKKYFLSILPGIITLGITWKNIHLDDREIPFFNLTSLNFRIKLSASPANLPKICGFSILPTKVFLRLCLLKNAVDKQPEL